MDPKYETTLRILQQNHWLMMIWTLKAILEVLDVAGCNGSLEHITFIDSLLFSLRQSLCMTPQWKLLPESDQVHLKHSKSYQFHFSCSICPFDTVTETLLKVMTIAYAILHSFLVHPFGSCLDTNQEHV